MPGASRAILPTESQVKSAFGLSSGESRLVICLAGGQTLQDAAHACGISYETARKRIKVVFEKTDTRRQSELIALVLRIGMLGGCAGRCGRASRYTPDRRARSFVIMRRHS